MGDANENLLSISQKLLKKISNRNLSFSDTNSESGSESNTTMESPERTSVQIKEQSFQNDSRFRKYVQLVEKNLQSFDAVNEWADIISFLGRLLKSFQAYPQFPVIPQKQLVAKRLAQCLNPGFPAGVHQKTLEVYAFILKTIGPDQLAEDLALWSTGLFPFVQYAATHVKPQLINIFETYYFPLRGKLRPAMRGFIIALLPALDEEGSEYFDRVVTLIENLSETVELPFFYSCLWLVMISNPSLRRPALNYLLRKLPKINDREAVAVVLGPKENVSLMVRAFSSTLNDQQLLVQRGMLELLVQNFMLKSRMIPHDDLVILIRAALGIVLRKDMSLNRRLYAWLLGAEGSGSSTYFATFAEKPTTQAVRSMLQEQQDQVVHQQKPYKILISLMDKWELGQPIVNSILVDALTSLKARSNAEVMQTANMWMDMMEPYLICMKLFEIMDHCFPAGNKKKNTTSLDLIEFTLDQFKLIDEEIKQIHFPLMLAALVKKLNEALKSPTFVEILPQVKHCISLVLRLLDQIPESVYSEKVATQHEEEKKYRLTEEMNVVDYAREFYGFSTAIEEEEDVMKEEQDEEGGDLSLSKKVKAPQPLPQQHQRDFEPLRGQLFVKEIVNNLTEFLNDFVNSYIALPEDLLNGVDVGVEGKRLKLIEHDVEAVLLGVCTAITIIAKRTTTDIKLRRGDQLTQVLLKCCQQVNAFGIVDCCLSTFTSLVHDARFVQPHLKPTQIKAILDQLWGFLTPSMQPLHMRTIELLWLLTEMTQSHQIETIVANYLMTFENTERVNNYEKFGIVWELSEQIPEASTVFSRPMFLMLDLLREGSSPLERRAGETWIRCHLKSYVRLLEPFMLTLLDKHILRRLQAHQVRDKEIPYYIYLKAFDTEVIDYMFTTLITLITFGGLNLLKTCKNHFVENEGAVAKAVQVSLAMDMKHVSFLELLISVSIRYLETEPSAKFIKTLTNPVRSIQLHASDLLYLIISKLDYVPMKLVTQVQTAVIHKLLYCIATNNLDLQQKLLHLLHACLAITCASAQQSDKAARRKSSDSISSTTSAANEALALVHTSSELFVKCMTDALSLSSHRSLLQHWVDFVLATLPYIKHGFRTLLVPVLICLCDQISRRCDTLEIMMHKRPAQSVSSNADKDILVLLLGLEKMIMFCLTERALNDDWFPIKSMTEEKLPELSQGLTSMMSEESSIKARDSIMYHLPTFLQLLQNSWFVFRQPESIESVGEAKAMAMMTSFRYASEQVKLRLSSIFEKLFKFSTVDFVEGLAEIFFLQNPTALEFDSQDPTLNYMAIDILSHTPTSTPQHIITTLLDIIKQRTPNTYHQRRRKILRVGKLTDISILRFAEIYAIYIHHPDSIVLLWPMIHSFSKDYLSQANTYKNFLPSLMRFLTVALDELSQSSSYEGRIRKDAQELYQRCIDYCILIAGKSFDQSLWMRSRSTTLDIAETDSVSVHTVDSEPSAKLREEVMIQQINHYLAHQVIPKARQLVGDNDKINSLLNNMVYYVIGPSLKSKTRNNAVILDQLVEIASMPFTYKTWRKEIWEFFLDHKFFSMNSTTCSKWLKVIGTAFSIEKERMNELLARIMTSPSNTFFSNKDQETLNRSLNLKRLSFVLFAGTIDQYVPQLPIIQEKMVELLKLDHGEMVHMEIYLLLRIILMRYSQKHLMNFWPVLITELMRLFNSFANQDFQDRPEEAQIALAGCKFLDLLCTLELDAFQIYQWIFIRDTVETLIVPQTEGPVPIMERLDKKLTTTDPNTAFEFSLDDTQPSLGSLKRPMLTMKSISSIRQLSFFIEHVGLYVYQSSFTLAKPDIPFIESLLQNDLLKEEQEEMMS